jgi:hypothetical protein
MIHIIGTCHKTQIWSDLIKKKALGATPLSKMEDFQRYLSDAAVSLRVAAIGEEMSEDRILDYGHNATSVAQLVARHSNMAHVFCEPNQNERQKLGLRAGDEMVEHVNGIAKKTGRPFLEVHSEEVRKQFPVREAFWATRLASHKPDTNSVLFICGADHCGTFSETLRQRGLAARLHCRDWTLLAEIPCPCCM